MKLTLRSDRKLIRAGARSTRYLRIDVVAPEAPPRDERAPVNIALVLDRSGSMAGERKFALARQAVQQALGMLHSTDRFALVIYDERIDVLVESTAATPEAKRTALRALAAVEPRGSTDLCGGWLRGCEQIALHLEGEALGRCLLVTDGLANHGETDRAVILRHAAALRTRGIATSTFGVGADFDERLLRDMAREGGGHSYFIERPEQIADLLTSELGETLETVVRDAVLEVSVGHDARTTLLNAFRSTHEDHTLCIALGNLVSAQELSCVVRVDFERGEEGEEVVAFARLGTRRSALGPAQPSAEQRVPSAEVRFTYATHAANDTQPRDREVDVEVATVYAARARAEATERNRRGDYEGARRVLERTAQKIRSYAGDDRRLHAIADSLDGELPTYAAPMAPVALKQAYFAADAAAMSRAPGGKARRRS